MCSLFSVQITMFNSEKGHIVTREEMYYVLLAIRDVRLGCYFLFLDI